MPMAIGTAIISAKIELSTVTRKRSAMPKRRLFSSVVTNSELVMKLALFAASDGIAADEQEERHQRDRADDRRARGERDRLEDGVAPAAVAPSGRSRRWSAVDMSGHLRSARGLGPASTSPRSRFQVQSHCEPCDSRDGVDRFGQLGP